jgi:hypothetical protein
MTKDRKLLKSRAEKLALQVLEELDQAICVKLRQLKPRLEKLRAYFKELRGTEQIAGCKTWKEFCRNKLNRTGRAVRKLLAAEQSSARPKIHTLESHRTLRYKILTDQVKAYFKPQRGKPEYQDEVKDFFQTIAADLGFIVELKARGQ